MLRLHVPIPTRYVDFGKVFVPNGALDFSTLAASDPEVARFGPQLFNRGLVFPDNSPFAGRIGSLSAALLMFEGGYLFTLVQRRREGELSTDPRTDRPFNQVRFVLLNRENIEQAFAARAGLYSSLALAARDRESRVWLHDYTAPVEQQSWQPNLERLDPAAPSLEAVRFVANALVAAAEGDKPRPISVPLPGQDLVEKLQLVEAVQYWLLPKLGVFSFALDYISMQNVHLRLFALPPDAPAPLPPERVFVPGSADARFVDDYHTPISALSPEALFDPALPGLLGLRVSTSVAVELFKVEKQGEPLPGAQALALYPELARLAERRFNFLRRVPPPDLLELLRHQDLPAELRLDLLKVALDASHGLLVLYAPAHLAVPRPARDDERVRALLRASLAKSPEASLGVGTPADQAELYRDLLLARRGPPFTGRGQPPPPPAVVLDTGQPVLEALILWRRTPELAAALDEVVPQDPALFTDALVVLDRVTDLKGLLWLWRSAGRRDLKKYAALLERAVQPAWYPALARDAATWQSLLADGRALALGLLWDDRAPDLSSGDGQPGDVPSSSNVPPLPARALSPADSRPGDAPSSSKAPPPPARALGGRGRGPGGEGPGVLLRALPRQLVPFVWQASLATSEHDAEFAEWWLFNEALALPDQLPALWDALQKLPSATLPAAGPELNYLLGRAYGLSLLRACTPPGDAAPNEALYAAVLGGWLAVGFRSPVGDLALGTDDVEFLIAHLPGSNDILAAVAASPAQAKAVSGLSAADALKWARAAAGDRRQPYRVAGKDWLLQRLLDLPAADDDLLWHLLVEDDGTAPAAMPWPDYVALVTRVRVQLSQQPSTAAGAGTAISPPADDSLSSSFVVRPSSFGVPAFLDVAAALQNLDVPAVFYQNQIDIRRVFALLAVHSTEPADGADLVDSVLPLAIFHLQETSPDLRQRAAALLSAGLRQADIQKRLHVLPDAVLTYLRDSICQGQPALTAPSHWIDAELSRRKNAYRLEVAAKAASPRRNDARPPDTPSGASASKTTGAAPSPRHAIAPPKINNYKLPRTPPPPPPSSKPASNAKQADVTPLLGQIALPTARHKKADSAIWLWIAIVLIGLLTLAIIVGALVWAQSLS